MSTVDEWAKREAEKRVTRLRDEVREVGPREQASIEWAFNRMAALLLSDEAVKAAALAIWEYEPKRYEKSWEYGPMRAALSAALTKITEDKE